MKLKRRWLWVSPVILPIVIVGLLLIGATPVLSQETAAQATTVHAVINAQTRQPTEIPPILQDALAAL